jgi:hypothetical protein
MEPSAIPDMKLPMAAQGAVRSERPLIQAAPAPAPAPDWTEIMLAEALLSLATDEPGGST